MNAELAVGDLAETITVSGAAPMVDTQNVSQQSVFAREVTENLPVGSTVNLYATLIPGAAFSSGAASQDVGGSKGEFQQGFIDPRRPRQRLPAAPRRHVLRHAGRGGKPDDQPEPGHGRRGDGADVERDRRSSRAAARSSTSSRATAATLSAARSTAPGSTKSLQSDNLDDELRARGVTSTPYLRKRYDVGGGVGGPIQQDKIWFFVSVRSWVTSDYYPGNYFNATPGTLFYTPDLSRPAYDDNATRRRDSARRGR